MNEAELTCLHAFIRTGTHSAREDFANLLNHPAWQRIVAYYDGKIAYLEKVINGDIKDDQGECIIKALNELHRWRYKRNMAIQFRSLPEILTAREELSEQQAPELDPFE